MQSLFDPVVLKVVELVKSQAQDVEKTGQGKIDVSVLKIGMILAYVLTWK